MNSNTKYSDIEFCTNLLFNAIYGVNDNCYQIQTLDKKNIKLEDLRKPLDYDYTDIFKGKIKFLGIYNRRLHYKVTQHFHPYEIAIGINNLNLNDISRPELNGMAYLLMCSEITFNEKFINFTLPIMCFDIMKSELEKLLPTFNDDIKEMNINDKNNKFYVIVTEHFLSTNTLKEYLDNHIESLTSEQIKKILFEIFIIIAKLNERFNNFSHNNINLDSLKIVQLTKPETHKYKINGVLMENPDVDFILKIDDFDNAMSSDYNFNENNDIMYNPYVDINIIMNHLYVYLSKNNKIDTELEEFFNEVIPEKYRINFDIEKFNQNSNVTITSEIVLRKNKFFKNFIKMEVSVTPRNIEKMDVDNLQQKDEGILYIDYNKKNKKSNKYYSMYKGVRQIVVSGLRKNSKKDLDSEGSLFFKDEVTESHNKKDEKTTETETTVRETMNTINPNVTSSSSSESETTSKNKSSSSSTESEAKQGTEMSADSKAIMRALAQNTARSDSEMSRSKSKGKKSSADKKSSSKKGKRSAKESSSSLSSSVSSSVKSKHSVMSEGGMYGNLSAKSKSKLKKLPQNYFDLAPEGLVQEMLTQQNQPQIGMHQNNPMSQFLGDAGLGGDPTMNNPVSVYPQQPFQQPPAPGAYQPGAYQPGVVPPPGAYQPGADPSLGVPPVTGLEAGVNNFLSGNMMGGSKGNQDMKQYKLNFF